MGKEKARLLGGLLGVRLMLLGNYYACFGRAESDGAIDVPLERMFNFADADSAILQGDRYALVVVCDSYNKTLVHQFVGYLWEVHHSFLFASGLFCSLVYIIYQNFVSVNRQNGQFEKLMAVTA